MRAARIAQRRQQVKGMKNRIKAMREAGVNAYAAGIQAGFALAEQQRQGKETDTPDVPSTKPTI